MKASVRVPTAIVAAALIGLIVANVASQPAVPPIGSRAYNNTLGSAGQTSSVRTPSPALDRTAVGALYGECIRDTHSANGGTEVGTANGPVVAIVGDSITSQIRSTLTTDAAHRWVVWSRCGISTENAVAAGALQAVLTTHPAVVIIALGTNDGGYTNPQAGASRGFWQRAQQVRADLAEVPCVIWVTLAQIGQPTLQAEMDAINSRIDELPGVLVADWAAIVGRNPAVLTDAVHLSTLGIQARVDMLRRAVDECSTSTGP